MDRLELVKHVTEDVAMLGAFGCIAYAGATVEPGPALGLVVLVFIAFVARLVLGPPAPRV